MLRKRGGGELPTSLNQSSSADGSGKSIKMEAPLAKAIRSADGFIKGTYIWCFISIFFIWGGWTWIRRSSASMILDCNASGCTLTVQTPYYFVPRNSSDGVPIKNKKRRKTKIEFKRDQLVRADNIKWDPNSQQILENYGLNSPSYASQQQNNNDEEEGGEEGGPNRSKSNKPWNQQKKKKYKKKYNKNKSNYNRSGGPDADGNYESYLIILRDPVPPESEVEEEDPNESPSKRMQRQMAAQHNSMTDDPNSLASLLEPFAITEDASRRVLSGSTEYHIHPRDFNLGQTRRLARTSVSKINAYTKGRRASCIIRESRPVAWQGLVSLILGIFSFVLCLLLGQFWEEHDPTKVGSYRKRMAEIRKREEAKKLRSRRNAGRRAPARRPGQVSQSTGRSSASRTTAATGSARVRPNAGANRTMGDNSWVGSVGGAAHGFTKRGY